MQHVHAGKAGTDDDGVKMGCCFSGAHFLGFGGHRFFPFAFPHFKTNYAPDIQKIDDELNREARRFRRGRSMIRKSGHRFSEKIVRQNTSDCVQALRRLSRQLIGVSDRAIMAAPATTDIRGF
jgi:hypothetical protein